MVKWCQIPRFCWQHPAFYVLHYPCFGAQHPANFASNMNLPSNFQHPSGAPAGLQIHPNPASHFEQCGYLWMDDPPPMNGQSGFYTQDDPNEELHWWLGGSDCWYSILLIARTAKFLDFNKLTPNCNSTMSPWGFVIWIHRKIGVIDGNTTWQRSIHIFYRNVIGTSSAVFFHSNAGLKEVSAHCVWVNSHCVTSFCFLSRFG